MSVSGLSRLIAAEITESGLKGKALEEALAKALNTPDTKANEKLITKKCNKK